MIIYSIRTKILSIVLVFFAIVTAAFIAYSMSTTANYRYLRLNGIEKTVEFETEKVNKIIAEIERSAVFFAIGALHTYESRLEEFGKRLAVEFLTSFPAAIGGGFWYEPYVFDPDNLRVGFYAFYDSNSGGVRIDDTFFMDEYDYHNTLWYKEITSSITEEYQVVWTRPYIDDSGSFSMMTTAGSGVFDHDGKLIAISTVDWRIAEVVKELIDIKPTENSFVLLCVPDKNYIISATERFTGVNFYSLAGESMDNIPWNFGEDSFTLNGVKFLCFRQPMDNGWLLSIQIPEDDIFDEIENRSEIFSIRVAIASVVMLFFAFLLISRLVNAPIKQLTNDVSKIALGSLDEEINIDSRDEIGLLAKAFNKMTKDLKESIDEKNKEQTENERIATELNIASRIQASMLPCVFPPFPERKEFDLYALMVPAKEVGGDFYDFYFIDKDNLAVVIADVSGKGVPAALFMVISKTLIKYSSSSSGSLKTVLESVNKKLCEGNDANMFVTAFVGFLNIPTGRFVYVNAGHNPPLLKKRGKKYEYLLNEPCLIMGFLENAEFKENEIFLESGDLLYLYTDGITEAMNNEKTMFGEERLLDILNRNEDMFAQELLTAVMNEVNDFAEGAQQADDITMLGLQINEKATNVKGSFYEMEVIAKTRYLDDVIEFISGELDKSGMEGDIQKEICIAAEEIFINIAEYAYGTETGSVLISICADDEITILFEDSGKPYNPLEQPAPDLDKSPGDRQIGGLGIYMVKNIMDSIEYTRKNGKNILKITKNPRKNQLMTQF